MEVKEKEKGRSPVHDKKRRPIPAALSMLNPEVQARPIAIGLGKEISGEEAGAYLMYPLPEGAAEALAGEVSDFVSRMFRTNATCVHGGTACTFMQIMCEQKKLKHVYPAPNPCSSRECPFFTQNNNEYKSVIEEFFKNGLIPKLLSYAIFGDMGEAEWIKANMTISQVIYAMEILWKINFAPETLPDETAENFQKLLSELGLVKTSSRPVQETLMMILSEVSKLPETNTVRLEVIKILENTDSTKFMPDSLKSSASQSSTSEAEDGGDAPSLMDPAPEDVQPTAAIVEVNTQK